MKCICCDPEMRELLEIMSGIGPTTVDICIEGAIAKCSVNKKKAPHAKRLLREFVRQLKKADPS